MARQIERRLHGQTLRPYTYRDFGSLVSLGKWSTVGMGFPFVRSIFIEGLFARFIHRVLRILHEQAIRSMPRIALSLVARALAHRTAPR